jgi:hypothetical protein
MTDPRSTMFDHRATDRLPGYRTWTDNIPHRRPGSDLVWRRRYESWTEDGVPFGCWRWEVRDD